MAKLAPEKWVWTEERLAQAAKLAGEGLSSSQIAVQIGAPSRNVVIGKFARHGIPLAVQNRNGPPGARNTKAARAAAAANSEIARSPVVTLSTSLSAPAPEPLPPVPMPKPRPAVPEGAVTILALRDSHCRYPLWNDNDRPPIEQRFYCGERIDPTAIYCEAHAERCFVGILRDTPKSPFIPRRSNAA
jgi:hypothetical protein